jgi:hypothetical protein
LGYLAGALLLALSCRGGENTEPEECRGGQDEDLDGLTDCGDPDCDADPACQEPPAEVCDGGQDEDRDGLTDCGDPDCAGSPLCPEDCGNGIDDDQNGFADCQDATCAQDPVCLGSFSGATRAYIISSMDYPDDSLAFDLNGDGFLDNGLDDVVADLEPFGINAEAALDANIITGALLTAIAVTADDFADDAQVGAISFQAATADGLLPRYDGTDVVTRSGGGPDAVYSGAVISQGHLTTSGASLIMGLPLDANGQIDPILLAVEGARLDADISATTLFGGRLGGFVRNERFSQKLPQIVDLFERFIDVEARAFAQSQGQAEPIRCVSDQDGVSAACGNLGRCTATDGASDGVCLAISSDGLVVLLLTDNAAVGGDGDGVLDVVDLNGDGRFDTLAGDVNEAAFLFNVNTQGVASGVIGQHFVLDLDGDAQGDALAVALTFTAITATIQ